MIAATALRIAGPDALLVARPTGVAHVYAGPLTPTGRFVPRSHRTVCRAHTRQLRVLDGHWMGKRLCGRCSDRLSAAQAVGAPRTRDDFLTRYRHLSVWDLAVEVTEATDTAALDMAAFLSLLLHGPAACRQPVLSPAGDRLPSLHRLVGANRHRLAGYPEDEVDTRLRELGETSRAIRRAEWQEIRTQQDERIRRLGFVNATTR